MIAYLSGTARSVRADSVVVLAGGVGRLVTITPGHAAQMHAGLRSSSTRSSSSARTRSRSSDSRRRVTERSSGPS